MGAVIDIDYQVSAMEVMIFNKRGHLDVLDDLVGKNKRPPHDPELIRSELVALEAALNTLKTVQKHKERWREVLREIYQVAA